MSAADLYDQDFYEWTQRNAQLVRDRRLDEVDLEHVAEELEDMGKREKRQLESRLAVLVAHLLKWQAQPGRRSTSWEATIRVQRRELGKLLKEMPSLKRHLAACFDETYSTAVDYAVAETGVPDDTFPSTCPFGLDQVLDPQFLP